MNLLAYLVLILFSVSAGAATINAADCNSSSVQTAINSASAGDTVNIPAGNCTWSTMVTLNKGITLQGQGTASTVITGGGTLDTLLDTSQPADNTVRVTGIHFVFTTYANPRVGVYVGWNMNSSYSVHNLRIDHNKFTGGTKCVFINGSHIYGVIDHNTFVNCDGAIEPDGDPKTWNEPIAAGTANALFIEDNTFLVDNTPYGSWMEQEQMMHGHGSRTVIRYNTFDLSAYTLGSGLPLEAHGNGLCYTGNDSNDLRGMPIMEIYNNTFLVHHTYRMIYLRGGSNLIHDNTLSTISGTPGGIVFAEEEGIGGSPIFDTCRSTAWPAVDQVTNTFVWNNTSNGVPITSIGLNYPNDPTFIQEGRDYFMHAPAATGGRSTYGARPGVDMTFSASGANAYYPYTPYAYPHPLVSGNNPPTITSASTASGTTGTPFVYSLTCSNTPTGWTATGLPGWASFDAGTQQITGTPNIAGTTNVTIGCSNAYGSDSKTLAITVAQAGAPTYIQSAVFDANNSGTAGTAAATFSANNTAGNFLIAVYSWDSADTPTCSDSRGNTYTQLINTIDTGVSQSFGVCYAANIAGGANTVTVTFTAPRSYRGLVVSEYSNIATASPIDVSTFNRNVTGTTATDNYTSTAATTATAGDLIWGGLVLTSTTGTIQAGTGFTQRGMVTANPTWIATQDKVQVSAGSITSTNTVNAAARYVSALVALKASGASGNIATLAVAEAADTVSAAAGGGVVASLAKTEAADTLSATSTLTIAAVLAKTEANQTVVSLGGSTIDAALTKLEAADSGTGDSQTTLTGTLAKTEAADSLSAAATIVAGLSGGLAVMEVGDFLSPNAVGVVSLSGLLARTEAADSLTAVGTADVTAVPPTGQVSTAKYCVRADGSAVSPIDTQGVGTDPTQCMSMATANAQTYPPGATILIFAVGGTFTTPLSNTASPCTGVANSSGLDRYPVAFVGVPDTRGNAPVIDGAALTTPQVCVGDGADYVQITGVDVWGSKVAATPSVRIGSNSGAGGAGYTVQLNSVRVLGNNRNSLSGDHSCFEIAGSGSSVDFFGVTGTGCARSAGEAASGVSAGLAVYGTSRATIGNSSASLSGQCLYAAETGRIEATSVACSRILYNGVRHGGIASTTCSDCSFDFGATYTTSGGAGFFGADADLPASSISLVRPKITVRTSAAARVGYGAISMSQGSILVDSPYFEWKPAGQVTLGGMQNRLRTTVATPKHLYSAQAGSTSIFDSNTWTYEDRSSIRRAVPFRVSGSLTATNESHIGCSRLYGSPTAAIIYGTTGSLSLSGVTCR